MKLLVGATLIVLALMSSAFFLAYTFLAEETNTFTFELQSNQSQLLGQRFSNIIETATNTLKVLPTLDNQTKKALENQDKIKSLEVFRLLGTDKKPNRHFEWGEITLNEPPAPGIIEECLKSGTTYQAIKGAGDQTEVYFYSLMETNDPNGRQSIIRAALNLGDLIKKSGGAQTQIVNRLGEILMDTRNQKIAGTKLSASHPLFAAATKSPISAGTLEYVMPETQEAHLGTYILPGYNVIILSTIKYKDAMKGTFMLLEKMLLVGMILLGASLIVVVVFSIKLTRPLAELTEATNVISAGNFDLVLKEGSSDEIGILSRSMNQMSRKIKELLLESIEKVKIEQEMAIASTLQQNLIPPPQIETERFAIMSHYQSAAECGGDWWGYVETNSDITIFISDATGHGLPPAMLTAATHGCVSTIRKILGEFPEMALTPSRLLRIANQVIVDSAKSELNMTMFIATYHFETKSLTFANAGHNTPWILRGSGGTLRFEPMKARGSRLGEKTGFAPSEDFTVSFSDEDILFLYTDGLLENPNLDQKAYGKDRVRKKLLGAAASGIHEMARQLNEDLGDFYEGNIPSDDVTYVLFSRTLEAGARSIA